MICINLYCVCNKSKPDIFEPYVVEKHGPLYFAVDRACEPGCDAHEEKGRK